MIVYKKNFHGAIEYAFFLRKQIAGPLHIAEWFIVGFRAQSRTELINLNDYIKWQVQI